jgi:anti-sigma-K factor RskA
MATHEQFVESVAGFALGALDPEERQAFEAHLAECTRCQADLREMRRVTAAIDLSVTPEAPPPSLRARTLASATAQPQELRPGPATEPLRGAVGRGPRSSTGVLDRPRTKAPLPSWVSMAIAASAALAVLAGLYAFALQAQVNTLREMVADATDESERLREDLLDARRDAARLVQTIDVLSAPDMKRVSLTGEDVAAGATGEAFWSRAHGLVLNAQRLPALDPNRVYQLWVVSAGQVHSGGVFRVSAAGTAAYAAPLPPNVTTVDAFAVSLEPEPGVPVRTGPMVLR